MADKSKIRYDDFISSVQPDPAKPESTIMLSGFVGRGPEGHARIYPDPTLGTWYDVPEGDVVYSAPIADSKLGGSYVWVRASAQIKPGSAAGGAGAGLEAAAAPAQPPVAITPQPTPATHCFICPPHNTPATICTLHGHCPPPPPTPATMCLICPPHQTHGPVNCPPHQTLVTLCPQFCTQFGCPPPDVTQPLICGVQGAPDLRLFTIPCPTPNSLCPGCNDHPATPDLPRITPGTIGPSGAFGCTIWQCPTLHSNWWECHTQAALCTVQVCVQADPRAAAAAPQAAAGGPQTHFLCTQGLATFCGCTPGIDCMAPPGGLHTRAPMCTQGIATLCGCPPGIDGMAAAARAAPQAVGINPTPATHCFVCDPKAAAAIQPTPTAQTHCFICPPHTQAFNCPTRPVLCDTMQMPTPATRCFICPPLHTQQVWCPTQPVVCNFQHTQPVVCGFVPPSHGCQQGAAQPQPQAVMAAAGPPNTGAAICTEFCTLSGAACTAATQCIICPTPYGSCTYAECQPTIGICPTKTVGGCGPQAAVAAAGPPNSAVMACTALAVCLPTATCPTMPPACWPPATFPPSVCFCAQAPQAAAAGMPPAPHRTPFCTIPPNCPAQTQLVACPTQPGACTLPVQCYQPTWFGCPQGGAQPHAAAMAAAAPLNTAATLCTAPPACLPTLMCPTMAPGCWTAPSGLCAQAPQAAAAGMQPTPLTLPPWVCGAPTYNCQPGGGHQQPDAAWTMLATKCICNPQPAAAAAPGPAQTAATLCTAPQACFPTLVVCPTMLGVCPTVATGCWTAPSGLCAFAPTPNGVFTPFGR